MAERWQQWMPFHIDRFRGSPDVRAMHPAAQMGYLYLLGSQWQSDDCTISCEALDLASESCLGDELWAVYHVRILRKFEMVPGGRLRNQVCFTEWQEAKRIFESRQAAARRTTEVRAPRKRTVTVENLDGDRRVTDTVTARSAQKNERSADTITGTGTTTGTSTEVQQPSEAPSGARVKKSKRSRSVDPRHTPFREAFERYFLHKNPTLAEAPWDGQEAAHLGRFLAKNPSFTVDEWRDLLRNRAKSLVNHSQSLSAWAANALTWAAQPANGGTNGHHPAKSERIVDSVRATIEARHDNGAARPVSPAAGSSRPGHPDLRGLLAGS